MYLLSKLSSVDQVDLSSRLAGCVLIRNLFYNLVLFVWFLYQPSSCPSIGGCPQGRNRHVGMDVRTRGDSGPSRSSPLGSWGLLGHHRTPVSLCPLSQPLPLSYIPLPFFLHALPSLSPAPPRPAGGPWPPGLASVDTEPTGCWAAAALRVSVLLSLAGPWGWRKHCSQCQSNGPSLLPPLALPLTLFRKLKMAVRN